MGDIWQSDKLLLFIAFFLPGFIATQVYGLFVSTDDTDIVKRLPAVIAYSAIHYAATGWLILFAPAGPWQVAATYLVVLVLPILWAPLVLLVRDPSRWQKIFFSVELWSSMLSPEASPWDRIFTGEPQWIRIMLKNGMRIGGFLGRGSVTSSYPCHEQIYVKNAFQIDQTTGEFGEAVPGAGVLVNGTEISVIEIIDHKEIKP